MPGVVFQVDLRNAEGWIDFYDNRSGVAYKGNRANPTTSQMQINQGKGHLNAQSVKQLYEKNEKP